MQLRVLCLLALNALAQPPSTPVRPAEVAGDGPLLKINVQLVQVDVVVTDSKGRHIADLRPEDFEVSQDGKPREITHFSYVADNRPLPAARAAASAATPPSNTPAKSTDIRRTIALVVDDLGLAFDNLDYVRAALTKFVDTQIQPGDLVAIVCSGAGAGALQQFTTDKRILHAAIKQLKFNFRNRVGIHSFAPIQDTRSAQEMMTEGANTKDTESGVTED
jgi:VWFA-related protein